MAINTETPVSNINYEGVAIPLSGGSGGVRPNVFMANYDKDLLTPSLELWSGHELETGYADYSKIEVGDYIIGYGVYGDDCSETHTKNFILIFKVESFDEGKTLCNARVVGRSMETSGSSGGSTSGVPANIMTTDTEQTISGRKKFEDFNILLKNAIPIYEDRETTNNYVYNIENIQGENSYGFELNDAGYYESTNKGIDNMVTYSLCKISFTMHTQQDLVFEVINNAEPNFDYGLFGKLDTELVNSGYSDQEDLNAIEKSFKEEHSANPVLLTYSQVPAGEHFIMVKYIKDQSGSVESDALQFKIISPIGEITEMSPVIVGYDDYSGNIAIDKELDLTYQNNKLVTHAMLALILEKAVTTDTEQTIGGKKTFSETTVFNNITFSGSAHIKHADGYNAINIGNQEYNNGNISGQFIGDQGTYYSNNSGLNNVGIGNNVWLAGDGINNCTAIGYGAKVQRNGYVYSAIQLGEGNNEKSNTFQVFNYQMLDANGQIPAERLTNVLGDINTLLTTLNSGEGV